ncbi:GerAB/ArcD/ProY family transporter [Carboxydochorda subterranea]|uniref:GerAB/ArcD/ProY family transporter n=1 Tax=Carboxydichorda subterranea TaxID=3109565 RepID=A0ABZ1C1I7_9FIRM|nr:GerAB/ArcD/ProY family transporter [Limnochorda sp. L945t]WRP18942.1 GerAB/ArcD/ProY family transporter [Limnochorda sp. L945t]
MDAPAGRPGYRRPGDGLTSSQVFWFALTTRLTNLLALMPILTATRAGRDAWIALIASIPVGMGLAWAFSYGPSVMPGAGLAEQLRKPLGKWAGGLVTVLFVWSYLHRTTLVVRDYSEVVVSAVLPRTPLVVVVAVTGLAAAVIAFQDSPTVGRVISILGTVVVIAVVAIGLLLAPQIELARLQPVLQSGWRGLLSGVLAASAWHTQVFFYPAVAPSVLDHPRSRRALMAGVAAASGLGALLVVLVVSVMSEEVAAETQFPLLSAAQLVLIGEFIQRVDALAVGAWGLSLLSAAGLFLHSALLGLSELLGLGDHRRLVRPMALLVIVGAMVLAGDLKELKQFSEVRVLAPYMIGLVWVPTAVWVAATWWRRPGSPGRSRR